MAQLGNFVPVLGGIGVVVIESLYVEILVDLEEKNVELFEFFSDANNYGDPIEFDRIMTNRNRAAQKRKMIADHGAWLNAKKNGQ